MSKRTHEEDDPKTEIQSINAKKAKLSTNESQTSIPTDVAGLSKEERKALKRAKKAARQTGKARIVGEEHDSGIGTSATVSASNNTSDGEEFSKAERKALKRAKKEARKAEEDNKINGSSLNYPKPSKSAVKDVTYQEHLQLSALPQSEIDLFVSQNHLAIDDPLEHSYRPITSFQYLPLENEALRKPFSTFKNPTPIQAACWPYLFAGRDVIGVAETGSGKTMAFALPCIRYISSLTSKEKKKIQACVVSPTRELAMQIHSQMVQLAEPVGLKVALAYGGTNKDAQREALHGAQIVVATPGRLNDFIGDGSVDLSSVSCLVLDEADRMLDKGFEVEVRKIISNTKEEARQTLMFTATWPPSVRELASSFMQTPVKVTIGDNASGELRANAKIVQEVEVIEDSEKQGRLLQLLKQYQSGKKKHDRILVFCLYKKEATRIEAFIHRNGFNVAGIHGDLNQSKRTESLAAFKDGKTPLLVATDVAARGLDIPAVKLVINYTFPLTVEDYVHRIGRTGRAGQDGKAITLFTTNEKPLSGALINVLKAAGQNVPEELLKFGTTVKKKGHEAYGAFYKDTGDMKKASRITFD